MNNYKRLIDQYKDKVLNIGQLSITELFNTWIKKDFIKEIDIDTFYDTDIKRAATIEIIDSDKYRKSGLSKENMKFLSFIVKNEGNGREYHNILRTKGYEYNEIYAIMEINLEYIFSNCSKLFLDLVIERGIDKKDYDEENIKLIEYLSRIEALENGWY